ARAGFLPWRGARVPVPRAAAAFFFVGPVDRAWVARAPSRLVPRALRGRPQGSSLDGGSPAHRGLDPHGTWSTRRVSFLGAPEDPSGSGPAECALGSSAHLPASPTKIPLA